MVMVLTMLLGFWKLCKERMLMMLAAFWKLARRALQLMLAMLMGCWKPSSIMSISCNAYIKAWSAS